MAEVQAQKTIERLLFETGAIRVAPANKAFWYTSGTIGPYYSNTQNLIGGEAEANKLLEIIDSELSGDRLRLPANIWRLFAGAYDKSACYHTVADCIKECVEKNINIDEIDIISGGERRDWFFSFIAAGLLKKPHLTIYKNFDMALVGPLANGEPPGAATSVGAGALAGKNCLHVSDIVTEASSYARAWAPAVSKAGAHICASLTVLDRLQGGGAVLASLGIRHLTLAVLDGAFFDRALIHGHIDIPQHTRLRGYVADPNGSMRAFLNEHPEFLKDALSAGGKEAERARMCIESGAYGGGAGVFCDRTGDGI